MVQGRGAVTQGQDTNGFGEAEGRVGVGGRFGVPRSPRVTGRARAARGAAQPFGDRTAKRLAH